MGTDIARVTEVRDLGVYLDSVKLGNAYSLIKKEKCLPERKAQAYFGQLAGAIEYLHKCGIAHRDIKPENVVLDANDTVKLIDFLKIISKGYSFPENVTVSDEVKKLFKQIFILVENRINATHMSRCDWLQMKPEKTILGSKKSIMD
ncbi:uncharacterized protein LOC131293729 [Anopheles ziemanni]|uniref:uncharacterized protein LOC131264512 n=1 Tax=Anopheles coustani TaxID=139045 RepID=UPI0026585E57|nr:uncharacterized protein LOC131264512 [Anopheles coustani]XP_058177779.1 uncharacterized protein LOC131293729 [Anopheles ziemanni]